MTSQAYRWVSRCSECAAKKNYGRRRRAPLQQNIVGSPMEKVAMDILGPLPKTPRGNCYVLVISDYFTKWIESYALPDQTAVTVAEKIVSEFVSRFGVPRQLHSDQGTNFESKVMAEICKLLGMEKTRTTPLHPQSDGQVERFNRTLVEMLRGKLQPDQKDWDLQLPSCMMAYRSSVHESTGFTPNHLMLGREVEIPLDVITELTPDEPTTSFEYVEALQKRLSSAFESAREHLKQAGVRQKRNYDKKMSWKPLKPGDSVWLHNIRRKKGRNPKLDNPWEGPFLVTASLSDVVYRIQKSSRSNPKVVHVDRLKPYLGPPLESWLPQQKSIEVQKGGGKKPVKRKQDVRVEERSQKTLVSSKAPKNTTQNDIVQADLTDGNKELDHQKIQSKETKQDSPSNGRTRSKRNIKPPERFGQWVS